MKWLIMALLLAVYTFRSYVTLLNYRASQSPLPERVRDINDRERYRKWLRYSNELNRFNLTEQAFNLIVLLMFLSGPFAWLARVIAGWTNNPILQTLLFWVFIRV